MSFTPRAVLEACGTKDDSDIDVFLAALAFAVTTHEGIVAERYIHHAEKIATDVGAEYISLLNAGAKDDARTRLAALKHIIADREGYVGDEETYNDLQNADIIRVIDRQKGMPIALSILYIKAGRANGWQIDGLNFPGHFLCRIEHDGMRLIFDPFSGCKIMEAPDLRALLKKIRGTNAELSADFYKPCTNREILIRLQNNIKLRLIDAGDYRDALQSVEMMRLVDPHEYRLFLDAGVLYAKTGKPDDAIHALEKYINLAPDPRERREAESLLRQVRDLVD